MSGPQVFEASARGHRWTSFVNVCKTQFQFDPEKDGAAEAGAALKALGLDELARRQYLKGLEINPRNRVFRREDDH